MPEMTTGPNVSWLDEELRRARAIVDDLRDVTDKQQVRMVDQEQRIMALEDRLAKVHAELLKLPEAQEAAQRTRDEIVLRLSEMRQDTQKRETESLRARQIEREQDSKALQTLVVQLDRLGPLEQGIAMRQAVEQRLNEAVLRLQQDIERGNKLFPQIEESRRQLQDGLNKLLVEQRQTAGELEELRQGQQPIRNSLVSMSMNATKLEQRIGEFDGMRQELTAQQHELVERERLCDRERAQTLTEWGRKLEGFTHQLETWADQMRFSPTSTKRTASPCATSRAGAGDQPAAGPTAPDAAPGEEQLRRELREWQNENQRKWAQEAERVEARPCARATWTVAERPSGDDGKAP